ncbi:hypothetical protein RND81_02G028200 [Saponaria officinalis]|uniref:F-box domain-containing protein n=1 Tax=Saponaria officinalis TaxID=3572 RepID=A0AAW1MQC3_SAPOF
MKNMKPISQIPPILDLPSHIISHIFSFLPTKSILSCKCVCKIWCSIIRNPDFNLPSDRITLIVHRFGDDSRNNDLYLVEPEIDFVMREIYDDSFLRLCKQSVINFNGIPVVKFEIVNSCNGLICLTSNDINSTRKTKKKSITSSNWGPFFVCNPVTSDHIIVKQTMPSLKIDEFCLEEHYGFGFCAQTRQYKVLRFFSYKKRYIDDGPLLAEIYTVGFDKEWRRVENPPQNYRWEKSGLFFEGALHWIILNKNGFEMTIATFKFHDEKFSLMSPPVVLSSNDFSRTPCLNLASLNSQLCFCVWAYDGHCDIWVMNEYGVCESWKKLFVVSGPDFMPLKPLAYMKSGEILMLTVANQLVSYDVRSNKWTAIQFPGCVETVEAMLFDPVFAPMKGLVTPLESQLV